MKPDEALLEENQRLKQERDDAQRWARAWKAGMRRYWDDCPACIVVVESALDERNELAAQVGALRGVCRQFLDAYYCEDLTVGDNMLEDAAQMVREALIDLREATVA